MRQWRLPVGYNTSRRDLWSTPITFQFTKHYNGSGRKSREQLAGTSWSSAQGKAVGLSPRSELTPECQRPDRGSSLWNLVTVRCCSSTMERSISSWSRWWQSINAHSIAYFIENFVYSQTSTLRYGSHGALLLLVTVFHSESPGGDGVAMMDPVTHLGYLRQNAL